MAKKDYMSIHYLRIFACLLVIVIHVAATPSTLLPLNSPAQIVFLAVNQLSKAAVPIFVFISGFILSKLYKSTKIEVVPFWTARLPKIVSAYVIWSLIYYIAYTFKGIYPLELAFILKGLLYGTFVYHLYFMIIIIQFYILFPVLHNLSLKMGRSKFLLASTILQLSFLAVLFPYKDRSFLSYIIYFALGMAIAAKPVQVVRKKRHINVYLFIWIFTGLSNFAIALAVQNQWINWSANLYALLFVLSSSISIMSLYLFFEGFALKRVASESNVVTLSQSTQLIYFSHPFALFATEVIANAISIESLTIRALLGFASVVCLLVPFVMHYKAIYRNLGFRLTRKSDRRKI
jgi:surface polysaccharide O-acyltransferase-like enzyme